LVQSAYIQLGYKGWFKHYALLGDDIVIGQRDVAYRYLHILRGLDVEVNLSKSILSPKGESLEFAKRFFYKGQDESPIAIKEMLTLADLSTSLELVRKYSLSLSQFLSLRGFGFRAVANANKSWGSLKGRLLRDK
jgi:hypothetical protein